MAKLIWDAVGQHFYETGCRKGVLYPIASNGTSYDTGVAWNGLTSVSVSPSGGDSNPIYADNMKYLDLYGAIDWGATINTYVFPDEFAECAGYMQAGTGLTISGQDRKTFGFSFQSIVGNDTMRNKYGYKIHMIFNAIATPAELTYNTVNDSPEAEEMSFEITTTPVEVGTVGNTTYDPVAYMFVESRKAGNVLPTIEEKLYGGDTSSATPQLPTPATIIGMFANG